MAEANYAEAVAEQDVISELLGKCFAARTVCEQKYIFENIFLRSFKLDFHRAVWHSTVKNSDFKMIMMSVICYL